VLALIRKIKPKKAKRTYAFWRVPFLGLAMDDEEKAVVSPFVAKEKFSVSGKQLSMNYPNLIGTSDVAEKQWDLTSLFSGFASRGTNRFRA
jgi:hypothetical protein